MCMLDVIKSIPSLVPVLLALALIGWDWRRRSHTTTNGGSPGPTKHEIELSPSERRIPLHLIFLQAIKGRRAKKNDNWTEDFSLSLRQAAIDVEIEFWGVQQSNTSELLQSRPLVPIPASHWNDFRIDDVAIGAEENFQICSFASRFTQTNDFPYCDLHVDKNQAQKWFDKWDHSD